MPSTNQLIFGDQRVRAQKVFFSKEIFKICSWFIYFVPLSLTNKKIIMNFENQESNIMDVA